MTQKIQATDPEFLRLLQADFKPKDTPARVVAHVQEAVRNGTAITDEDLDAIPDEGTRNLMKKWNRIFS